MNKYFRPAKANMYLHLTNNAAVGRTPPPPSVTPGWPAIPNPPNSPKVGGAAAAATKPDAAIISADS